MTALERYVAADLQRPVPAAAHRLAAEVLRRYPAGVKAILFYGSCLRRGTEEGVLDLYVLVSSYRSVHRRAWAAALNAALPPHVVALRLKDGEGEVRAKCSLVSLRDFRRHVSRRRFHPYFWARFAQPCALLWAEGDDSRREVRQALAEAVRTTVWRGLPLVPERFRPEQLWLAVLERSYRSELRPERPDAVRNLVTADRDRYEAVTPAALEELGAPWHWNADGTISVEVPRWRRVAEKLLWPARQLLGRVLALLRLIKGAFTLEDALEYAMWKIERHSGARPDPAWRDRHPRWLAGLRELWRLYRSGAVR